MNTSLSKLIGVFSVIVISNFAQAETRTEVQNTCKHTADAKSILFMTELKMANEAFEKTDFDYKNLENEHQEIAKSIQNFLNEKHHASLSEPKNKPIVEDLDIYPFSKSKTKHESLQEVKEFLNQKVLVSCSPKEKDDKVKLRKKTHHYKLNSEKWGPVELERDFCEEDSMKKSVVKSREIKNISYKNGLHFTICDNITQKQKDLSETPVEVKYFDYDVNICSEITITSKKVAIKSDQKPRENFDVNPEITLPELMAENARLCEKEKQSEDLISVATQYEKKVPLVLANAQTKNTRGSKGQ
ncbi:MAG: hypothetical protein CL678_12695 [Bdellovibrionaceae bacterium]|nr:hypothetical protein [Pseudobdellovibrionaceae bacterium]|tara:strand:+ start:872 stop:1774 length:903 start_codon:yes stop_codon:yes gene_type:complete